MSRVQKSWNFKWEFKEEEDKDQPIARFWAVKWIEILLYHSTGPPAKYVLDMFRMFALKSSRITVASRYIIFGILWQILVFINIQQEGYKRMFLEIHFCESRPGRRNQALGKGFLSSILFSGHWEVCGCVDLSTHVFLFFLLLLLR